MNRCVMCDIDGLSVNKEKICDECNDMIKAQRRVISGKPPMGLLPRKFWVEKRIQDILDATNRYIQAEMKIPIEWTKEYNQLIEEINCV